MILDKFTIEQIAVFLNRVVADVTFRLTGKNALPADSSDDYNVGQRFYVDACQPYRSTFFVELSIGAKIIITESVFGMRWADLKNFQIDDCLLEFTGIIAARTLAELTGGKELLKIGFPMVVFDEYEDDFEVSSTEDFFRFDYRIENEPFSVLICSNCIVM